MDTGGGRDSGQQCDAAHEFVIHVVDDDERLDSDVVFGVTRQLVGDFRREDGTPPASDVEAPWYRLDYTFVMEPGEAKLPKPPIK